MEPRPAIIFLGWATDVSGSNVKIFKRFCQVQVHEKSNTQLLIFYVLYYNKI